MLFIVIIFVCFLSRIAEQIGHSYIKDKKLIDLRHCNK